MAYRSTLFCSTCSYLLRFRSKLHILTSYKNISVLSNSFRRNPGLDRLEFRPCQKLTSKALDQDFLKKFSVVYSLKLFYSGWLNWYFWLFSGICRFIRGLDAKFIDFTAIQCFSQRIWSRCERFIAQVLVQLQRTWTSYSRKWGNY